MHLTRRSFISGSTALLLCEQRAVYGASAHDAKKITLVNSITSIQNPYYALWDIGGRAFARSMNTPYEVLQNQGKPDDWLVQIRAIIEKTHGNMVLNVDLASRFEARPLAELCSAAKIFFVTHSYRQPSIHPWDCNPYYAAHLACNHTAAGSQTASMLISATGSKGRIVALGGPSKDIPAIQRKEGLDQELMRAPGCILLDYQLADWESSAAFEITRWWLAKYRDRFDGIWAANDRMALGAIEALRVYKVAGKVPVTGIDGLPDAIAAIRRGELTATVPWDSFYEGGIGLSIALRAKTGLINPVSQPDSHREFYLRQQVVSAANVDQFSHQRNSKADDVDWANLWDRANGQTFN